MKKKFALKLKKEKGFTLIELLAVIVILAIIAIIATPIVLNIINESRESTCVVSANNYIETVEKIVVSNLKSGQKMKNGIYEITKDGNICLAENQEKCEEFIQININGRKPEGEDDYIFFEDTKIKYYKLTYDNYVITDFGTYTKKEMESWISVKDFGAIGDGITDDTVAIKAAVNYINENGGVLYFPLGTYKISLSKNKDNVMFFNGKNKIVVELLGSSIVLNENSYTEYDIVKTKGCEDFTIRNGSIIGDRINHDYITMTGTHENGRGIYIHSTKLATIKNMNISQLIGEGIVNSNSTESNIENKTIIENSEISYTRKIGLSILTTDNIEVNNTKVHHIGTNDGIDGISTHSDGIYIGTSSGTSLTNSAHFNNVIVSDVDRYGIVMGSKWQINDYKINNSNIENANLRLAHVDNTKIHITNDSIATNFSYNGIIMTNSNVKFSRELDTLYLTASKIDNTKIEGVSKDEIKNGGNRLFFKGPENIVTNSIIENFWGSEVDNITTRVYSGVPYFYDVSSQTYNILTEASYNNTYKNCKIHIATDSAKPKIFGEINSKIEDGVLVTDGSSTLEFNKIIFNRVDLKKRNLNIKINLNDCQINESTGF